MRLIDADVLKKEWRMGDVCDTCDQNTWQCGNDYCFTRMDFCGMIDDAPTVNCWISVKDDLPKEFGEHCIVYDGCSVQYGDYYSDGTWYTPDCYESDEIRGVTHWMPLPEPPEGE